jgi:type VI protein secretion system component Hcp
MSMEIFLMIQEVGGASANRRYPGAIDVESFTMGDRQKSLALSQGLQDHIEMTPSAADMTIKKSRDAASDRIWAAATSGRVFSKAALIAESFSASQPSLRSVLTMIMSSVQITSMQTEGGSSNKEVLTLSFQNIHISQTLRAPA